MLSDECIFCQIIRGERPSRKVYETETIYAFHDINPQAPTHILIVPKKHIARLADITPEDAPLLGEMMVAAKTIAEQEGVSGGFRLVINSGREAGQSVFHVHLHLLGGRRMRWPPG